MIKRTYRNMSWFSTMSPSRDYTSRNYSESVLVLLFGKGFEFQPTHLLLVNLSNCRTSGTAGLVPQSPTPPKATNSKPKSSQDIESQSERAETIESTTAICCNPRASVVTRRLRTSAEQERAGCAFQQKWCAWPRAFVRLAPISLEPGGRRTPYRGGGDQ
jgi:hypothetical protein